jgi:hypothetical protein
MSNSKNEFIKNLLLGCVLLLFVLFLSRNALAKDIVCNYDNNKFILLKDVPSLKDNLLHYEDENIVIHIKNVTKYDEVEDYVTKKMTKNGKQYRMTYSIKCTDLK